MIFVEQHVNLWTHLYRLWQIYTRGDIAMSHGTIVVGRHVLSNYLFLLCFCFVCCSVFSISFETVFREAIIYQDDKYDDKCIGRVINYLLCLSLLLLLKLTISKPSEQFQDISSKWVQIYDSLANALRVSQTVIYMYSSVNVLKEMQTHSNACLAFPIPNNNLKGCLWKQRTRNR